MRERFTSRWAGVLISLIGIVATVWLAATGQLGLYIHPRYFVFTTVMAAIAAVLTIAAFAILPADRADEDQHEHHEHHEHEHDEHEHEHRGDDERAGRGRGARRRSMAVLGSALVVLLTGAALLVLPPATLTTSTVDQRDLNASVAGPAAAEPAELVGGDHSAFTVKDWASLIRQGAGGEFVTGKTATLTGSVTPDRDDANVFYVARFVVTCCAVDAQPVGVAVYSPGWESRFLVDSWVTVTGSFGANPSLASLQTIAITPDAIDPTTQPSQPYDY